MKEMENHGLVARNLKETETTYFFMNSLIKDVIYGQMLFSQRRQIHHTVARMYLKSFADNTAYHPILAYHFKAIFLLLFILTIYSKQKRMKRLCTFTLRLELSL
jgi:predicted ATPase